MAQNKIRLAVFGAYGQTNAERAYEVFHELVRGLVPFPRIHRHPDSNVVEITLSSSQELRTSQVKTVAELLAGEIGDCWDFVGPECPNLHRDTPKGERVPHAPGRENMIAMSKNFSDAPSWSCSDVKCRKAFGWAMIPRAESDVLTFRQFRLIMFNETLKTTKVIYPATTQPRKSTDIGDKLLESYAPLAKLKLDEARPPRQDAKRSSFMLDYTYRGSFGLSPTRLKEAADKALALMRKHGIKFVAHVHDEYLYEMPKDMPVSAWKEFMQEVCMPRMMQGINAMLDTPVYQQEVEGWNRKSPRTTEEPQLMGMMQTTPPAPEIPIGKEHEYKTTIEVLTRKLRDKDDELEGYRRGMDLMRDNMAQYAGKAEELEKLQEVFNKHSDVTQAANKMFMFLCRLDLQDHPIAEQKEFLALLRKFKFALQEVGVGKGT